MMPALRAQESGWDKLKIELAAADKDSTRVLAYYKIASETYKSTPDEAKEIASKGYQMAVDKKFDELQINLLNLLGVIDLKLNNFDKSIETHFNVIRMREARGDRQGVMLSFLNIGNVFNKSYDPDQAIVYYNKALAISKEIKDVRNQANISTNIGNIYAQRALDSEKKKDVDQAINYLVNTVKFCKAKAPDVDLYNSYILLSYLYLKNKDLNRSEYYTDLAIDITEKRKFPVGICYARINRANIYVQRGQFELAEQEVALIKRIIKESKLDYLEEELSGDFAAVAKAVKEKDTDVVFSDKDSSDIKFHQDAESLRVKIREELREKYDSEKRELENQNLQLENAAIESESDFVKLLLGGSIAVLLVFFLMMLLLKRKNVLLKAEKENVELARDEIKAQAEKIQVQHQELVQADRFRSRIFSVVSHDLRAPIANFQVLLSISKLMDLPTDEVKKTLIVIGQEVEAASKMLDELLVWSSQQMNNETLEMVELSVHSAVEECRLLFADRLKLKELLFSNRVEAGLSILGDQKRFEFILRNVISNAIKFSFFGKEIVVSYEETAAETVIAIADQGAGMDEEKLARLQKRDAQESYLGTFQEKGAGIGLMLCHEFANRMGWHIRMESKIGLGSVFYICVPK
ncbi:tetratricopeptide repeat-containing sensor histidine kinase [Sphingobacterium oryzagri]|uniref:histidine kinase n=1 Tax=Sphingobacterium oryzagri TaxID=3025669 RepID=A0ABY7WG12_9SPHI|nr:tetratricopeptide repeat-containing sensor histidine kinase [Sphingobacterium sp. KACC 22765]WDF67466.1 tetratricopeptide repeat-containing sensor histidine kinase [Sphingobacterium sp. KACC 22765]